MNAQFKLLAAATMFVALFATSLSAQTCDENAVFEIDRIKQEVETSLINATTAKVTLESGETLLAFYIKGCLIKLSVDNGQKGTYFSAELFFRDGFLRHIAEDVMVDRKMMRNYYYFKDDKLICLTNEDSGDYKEPEIYSKSEKKWLNRIEKYLNAIQ